MRNSCVAFAYYPVLLIVEDAGATFNFPDFFSALVRLVLVIYLVSSATLAFDKRHLHPIEIGTRAVLAFGTLMTAPLIHWSAFGLALALITWHYMRAAKPSIVSTN